jgi:hypothetical protein
MKKLQKTKWETSLVLRKMYHPHKSRPGDQQLLSQEGQLLTHLFGGREG